MSLLKAEEVNTILLNCSTLGNFKTILENKLSFWEGKALSESQLSELGRQAVAYREYIDFFKMVREETLKIVGDNPDLSLYSKCTRQESNNNFSTFSEKLYEIEKQIKENTENVKKLKYYAEAVNLLNESMNTMKSLLPPKDHYKKSDWFEFGLFKQIFNGKIVVNK